VETELQSSETETPADAVTTPVVDETSESQTKGHAATEGTDERSVGQPTSSTYFDVDQRWIADHGKVGARELLRSARSLDTKPSYPIKR
jgi:hypothetical protein